MHCDLCFTPNNSVMRFKCPSNISPLLVFAAVYPEGIMNKIIIFPDACDFLTSKSSVFLFQILEPNKSCVFVFQFHCHITDEMSRGLVDVCILLSLMTDEVMDT